MFYIIQIFVIFGGQDRLETINERHYALSYRISRLNSINTFSPASVPFVSIRV